MEDGRVGSRARAEVEGEAPGWNLRCGPCGREKPAAEAGIVRIGAASVGKRVLGYCTQCRRFRMLHLERHVPGRSGGVQVELTRRELAAYVAEGTMDVGTAERIAGSGATEPRKREIAGLIAEGALPAEEGVRLLSLEAGGVGGTFGTSLPTGCRTR